MESLNSQITSVVYDLHAPKNRATGRIRGNVSFAPPLIVSWTFKSRLGIVGSLLSTPCCNSFRKYLRAIGSSRLIANFFKSRNLIQI